MKPIKVALLGIGTVGSGVFNVLRRNQAEISARVGRGIEIVLVADRNLAHAKSITGDAVEVIDDAFAAVSRPDIDVVVELIGGYTVAKELVLKAIENGKHVVTANKALLAVHGTEIFKAAQQKGVMVAFEAAAIQSLGTSPDLGGCGNSGCRVYDADGASRTAGENRNSSDAAAPGRHDSPGG